MVNRQATDHSSHKRLRPTRACAVMEKENLEDGLSCRSLTSGRPFRVRLRCEDLHFTYLWNGSPLLVLAGISFELPDGQLLAIIGPSGCGKTTLLRCLAGLETGYQGRITLEEQPLDRPPRVLLVFQEDGLLPWLTVLENATLGLEAQGVPKGTREAQARELLRRVGLEGREHAWPHQLSAGMRQRVALVRSFLCRPDVLLLDEPFAALDAQTRLRLQDELLALWMDRRCSVVFVTHDIEEAVRLGDRVIVLSPAPARIVAEHRIALPRPRTRKDLQSPQALELKNRLYEQLGL